MPRPLHRQYGFTLKEIVNFVSLHRVEVLFDSSQVYLCYIDGSDGAYGQGYTFWEALLNGLFFYRIRKH